MVYVYVNPKLIIEFYVLFLWKHTNKYIKNHFERIGMTVELHSVKASIKQATHKTLNVLRLKKSVFNKWHICKVVQM